MIWNVSTDSYDLDPLSAAGASTLFSVALFMQFTAATRLFSVALGLSKSPSGTIAPSRSQRQKQRLRRKHTEQISWLTSPT
jgi:hypothetical protein